MAKDLNKNGAKRTIVKNIDKVTKKLERDRWLKTPEGIAWFLSQQQQHETARKMVTMKSGQLVWTTVMVKSDDLIISSYPCQRCCKILQVNDDQTVLVEMLYVMYIVETSHIAAIKEKKDEYVDDLDFVWKKGDKFLIDILDLEMHVAKVSKNIWWKEL